jgi:hypothetical protein
VFERQIAAAPDQAELDQLAAAEARRDDLAAILARSCEQAWFGKT